MSLVLEHGVKIKPLPYSVSRYKIQVTRLSKKTGKTIVVKTRDVSYPLQDLVVKSTDKDGKTVRDTELSVWNTIDEMYNYYYNKLKQTAK